jgi:hypothetical protein
MFKEMSMSKTNTAFACLLVACLLFMGCDGSTKDHESSDDPVADAFYAPVIDPANFPTSTTISNTYLSLTVGDSYTYAGVEDGTAFTVVVDVTAATKVILGVTCIVVQDQKFVGVDMVEDTNDWYAQDADGNVWYFGEDTATYVGGVLDSTEGSWEAGVNGAQPGIVMWANPVLGLPYRLEYLFGEAEDMAVVAEVLFSFTTVYGTFSNVMRTREFGRLDPGVEEDKYYAPGLGLIREEMVTGGTGSAELTIKTP